MRRVIKTCYLSIKNISWIGLKPTGTTTLWVILRVVKAGRRRSITRSVIGSTTTTTVEATKEVVEITTMGRATITTRLTIMAGNRTTLTTKVTKAIRTSNSKISTRETTTSTNNNTMLATTISEPLISPGERVKDGFNLRTVNLHWSDL